MANLAGTLLVALPESAGQEALVDALVAIVGRGRPGIARELVTLVANAAEDAVPPFCVIATVPRGVAVFLHGALDLTTQGGGGPVHLSGRDATTWVDRIVDASFETLTVAPSGESGTWDRLRGDLRDGVVPGSGVLLTRRPSAPAAPDPPSAAPAPPPAPAAPDPPSAAPAPPPAPAVPQEPAWLVLDTGAALRLDRSYVLGRAPEDDPAVVAGGAQPIVLDDAERTVSRVHARIEWDGGRPVLLDAGSANGTLVAIPEGEWTRIEPGVPWALGPGTRILLGERSLIVQRHRPPSGPGRAG